MIRSDYKPLVSMESNALSSIGWLIKQALKLAAAMAIIIILGADLDPLINWFLL